jgi:hypothetical protein
MSDIGLKAPPDTAAVKFTITPDGKLDSYSPKDPVKIYYKQPGEAHDATKKSKVAWTAVGLPAGHRIYITAKSNTHFGYMSSECHGPIMKSGDWVTSKGALRGPKKKSGVFVRWTYNVMVTDAAGKVVDTYDPGVDIGSDP